MIKILVQHLNRD